MQLSNRLEAAMLLLTLILHLAYPMSSLNAAAVEGVEYRVTRLWLWAPPEPGYVVDVEYHRGSVYVLAVENGVPVVYSLNASDGSQLWGLPLKLEGYEPLDLKVIGGDAIVAAAKRDAGVLVLYRVGEYGVALISNITLQPPSLYKILACSVVSPTTVVVGGSRYTADNGLQYFAAMATVAGVKWLNYTGGPGDEYFTSASVGPDGTACLAGPQGLLACYKPDGSLVYTLNLTIQPLSLKTLNRGGVVVVGVSKVWGMAEMVENQSISWRVNLSTIIPTAVDVVRGRVFIAGATAPKPYRLSLAVAGVNGSVLVVGIGGEGHGDLIVSSIAAANASLAIVAGRMDGKPFAEALAVEQVPGTASATQPETPPAQGGPSLQLYASIGALAGAAAALAATIIKIARRKRGPKPRQESGAGEPPRSRE